MRDNNLNLITTPNFFKQSKNYLKTRIITTLFRDLIINISEHKQMIVQATSIDLRRKSPWLLFLLLLSPKPGIKAVFVLMLNDWTVGRVNTHDGIVEIFSGDTEIVTTL